jgi:serine/threonine protein kinase
VLASDLDGSQRERFLREGFAMGKLSGHPNIVNILQVGVTQSYRRFIAGTAAHEHHHGEELIAPSLPKTPPWWQRSGGASTACR